MFVKVREIQGKAKLSPLQRSRLAVYLTTCCFILNVDAETSLQGEEGESDLPLLLIPIFILMLVLVEAEAGSGEF